MNQSLQRLVATGGDHSIDVSDVNAAAGSGRIGHSKTTKKSVEDYEKEEDSSLSVLKTIEEELLHQNLSYCQSMLF